MFSNNKDVMIQDLEMKIAELEQQLHRERTSYEDDRKKLKHLESIADLEERTSAELRNALRQKLQEIDERSKQKEIEESARLEEVEKDIERQREGLKQELEQQRVKQSDEMKRRVQAFSSSYNTYLGQIQQAFERLNHTALQIAENLFDADTDISGTFREQIEGPFGNSSANEEVQEAVSESTPVSQENGESTVEHGSEW